MMQASLILERSMQKASVLVVLAVLSSWAGAQAPVHKNKTVANNGAVKPKMSPSEEATAAAQAAAIAEAAALQPAAVAIPVSAQVGARHDAVSAEELAIAQLVHQGSMACELGTNIRVAHDASHPGYFHVQGKGFRYRMRPVVTSTGVIRLEDAKAGVVWLQMANKSMLMDQKKRRRVADECAHPEQMAYAQSMKTNPPPKLFDTSGMGR
jgi:hypothetical protein